MTSKTIFTFAHHTGFAESTGIGNRRVQRGVTLIELLIGISIGLLTIAVAMGALMVSRGVSGTVSDASQLQQQAAYVFRTIAQQVRQTGSLRLNLAATKPGIADAAIQIADLVAFETAEGDFNPARVVSGTSNSLTVGYRSYIDTLHAFAADPDTPGKGSLLSDCMGQKKTASDTLAQSTFTLNSTTSELRCTSFQNTQPQPIAQNIANFQVRYLMQTAAGSGSPQIQYVSAATVGNSTNPNWAQIVGVEACLVLYGSEAIDLPAGTTYTDCDGATQVDINTLPAPRTRRMHMVFRNVYQLRSQGLVGSAL
ncbi:PilW family protein [Paenacidovorax monticola]|uniref:PilW family protein n=1 Tax=Paenacidovorax monticola TaxID=1926868 RepID=A0A7H0HK36_9BURK|nr:PilW family protein [Paenacidovorax monticola]QNP60902.1 PilW family protein [Paenacidovorax monticola]